MQGSVPRVKKQMSVPSLEDGKEVHNYHLCNFMINT